MSKKAKSKVAKKAASSNSKTTAAAYKAMASNIGRKVPDTVGEHFRARIVEGKLSNEEIVKEVRAKHKGSKASMSSLYWNRQYLMNHDGIKLA